MIKFEFFKKKRRPKLEDVPEKGMFILPNDADSYHPEVFQKMKRLSSQNTNDNFNVYSINSAIYFYLTPDAEVIPVKVTSQVFFDERE